MAFNIRNSISGALAGAGAGSEFGGYGALIGAGIGALSGFSGSSGASSANMLSMADLYNLEMYNTMKDLYMMNKQQNSNEYLMGQSFDLNKKSMRYGTDLQKELDRYGTDLQKELNRQAFNFNNYFLDNAYQKTVADMKKAGINPILAAGHANVGSASAGSASAGSVTGSSNSAGSISSAVGNGVDGSSLMSAMANSANANTNKAQLGINAVSAVGEVANDLAGTAKTLEQVNTEKTQQDLNKANTALTWIDRELKNKDLDWYDRKTDSDIKAKLTTAKASLIQAMVADYLKESQAFNNITSAKAQWESATTGSPTRAVIQLIQGLTGDDPKGIGEKVGKGIKTVIEEDKERRNSGMNDNDKRQLKKLYDALGLENYGVQFSK